MQPGGDSNDGIFIDEQVLNDGGWTGVSRTSYVGSGFGLDDGNYSIKIESVKPSDFGRWSCTLIPKSGQILRGNGSAHAKLKPCSLSIE